MNEDVTREFEKMRKQIDELRATVENLNAVANKNNFSSTQTFNKDAIFSSRLRVPVFSSAPSVAEIGDIFALDNGELYVCTDPNPVTWTLVGSQV